MCRLQHTGDLTQIKWLTTDIASSAVALPWLALLGWAYIPETSSTFLFSALHCYTNLVDEAVSLIMAHREGSNNSGGLWGSIPGLIPLANCSLIGRGDTPRHSPVFTAEPLS